MLTPSIRRPPALHLGLRYPEAFGSGAGESSSPPPPPSLRGNKRKSLSSSGSAVMAAAGDGGTAAGNSGLNGVGAHGWLGEQASTPGEPFCPGLPKAISWADVARQFAPISVSEPSGGSHPLPSPMGRGDSLRASAFPTTPGPAPAVQQQQQQQPPAPAPTPVSVPAAPTAAPQSPFPAAATGGLVPVANAVLPAAGSAVAVASPMAAASPMAFGASPPPGAMVLPGVGTINNNVYGGGSVAEVLAAAVAAAAAAAAAAEAVVAAAPAIALSSSFGQGVMSSAS
ncbi:unnamed protein product, partial [Scytosiphon promiscuus]